MRIKMDMGGSTFLPILCGLLYGQSLSFQSDLDHTSESRLAGLWYYWVRFFWQFRDKIYVISYRARSASHHVGGIVIPSSVTYTLVGYVYTFRSYFADVYFFSVNFFPPSHNQHSRNCHSLADDNLMSDTGYIPFRQFTLLSFYGLSYVCKLHVFI